MANLQAALDEYKLEIAGLGKQKTSLTQEITVLRSKVVFLKGTVSKLGRATDTAQITYSAKLKQFKTEELELEEKIAIALEDLDALEKQKQVAESELETLEQQHEQEIIGHNKRLSSVNNEVTAVEKFKAEATKELVEINKQISIRQARFAKLDETVKQAEADTENELTELAQLVKMAKLKIDEINQQIDHKAEQYDDLGVRVEQEQAKLDTITAKHEEFLAYEKRADKVLKARESALLQGEANLTNLRRRNGVLDNI